MPDTAPNDRLTLVLRKPEIIYICKAENGNKTIGVTPIFCDKYEPPKDRKLSELDDS
jgi:hypothetical protein